MKRNYSLGQCLCGTKKRAESIRLGKGVKMADEGAEQRQFPMVFVEATEKMVVTEDASPAFANEGGTRGNRYKRFGTKALHLWYRFLTNRY
jgi:hypothetical protein